MSGAISFPSAAAIAPAAWRVGLAVRLAVAAGMLAIAVVGAFSAVAALGTEPNRPDIVDFHGFYLMGQLALEGRFADSYTVATIGALERAMGGGRVVLMPNAYPPFFGFAVAALPSLPVGASFLCFGGLACAFFLLVLRRAAGAWFWTALLATTPAVVIDLRIGQNGLLTAGLAGLATLAALRRSEAGAGLVAGTLAALKPHLAATLPLLFLLRGDRRAILVAAATALLLSGGAIVVLGPGIVPAFLSALAGIGRFTALGAVPLHRMVSLYATLLSLAVPVTAALLVHAAVGVTVLVATVAVARRVADARAVAGLSLMATAFVSPYLHDYDLAIVGVGLGLALPALACRTDSRRLGLILVAMTTAQCAGFLGTALEPWATLSVGGPVLLSWFCGVLAILRRPPVIVPRGHDLSPARARGPA